MITSNYHSLLPSLARTLCASATPRLPTSILHPAYIPPHIAPNLTSHEKTFGIFSHVIPRYRGPRSDHRQDHALRSVCRHTRCLEVARYPVVTTRGQSGRHIEVRTAYFALKSQSIVFYIFLPCSSISLYRSPTSVRSQRSSNSVRLLRGTNGALHILVNFDMYLGSLLDLLHWHVLQVVLIHPRVRGVVEP
jgi:hypothetical protein